MSWITRKRAFVALSCTVALAVAGVALAYFTSSGSGTGSASVGSASSVTLHATISSDLYPGSSSPVTFTVDNPSSGAQRVGTVSLASISVDAEHSSCRRRSAAVTPTSRWPRFPSTRSSLLETARASQRTGRWL